MHSPLAGSIGFLLLMLCAIASAAANEGTIKLLAVAEGAEGITGSAAEMHLEIRRGSGQVFISSFPATKLDTQISTRFANQIACKYVGDHCNRYDFFYTIKAKSSIIGGPSAGAAAALLTVAVLEGLPINQSMAMTGTIGSGELIGPVGYLITKLDAAKAAGVTKVLVPVEREYIGRSNVSVNLTVYGQELGIAVREVQTLGESLAAFTGQQEVVLPQELIIAPAYAETMRAVAAQLCNRSASLQQRVAVLPLTSAEERGRAMVDNSTLHGIDLLDRGRSYSAASVCFGANIQYTALALSRGDLAAEQEVVQRDIAKLERYAAAYPIRTMTDLETFMVVMDRLTEAEDALNASAIFGAGNRTQAAQSLAYAIERVNSAFSWSQFFGKPGKRFRFSEERLMESCVAKLAEAREHLDYLQLFLPGILGEVEQDIARAFADYQEGRAVLCLSRASLAKAQVNSVLGSIGIEDIQQYIEVKLRAAERLLQRNQQAGMFPLLGYSYYTYAEDLRESNPSAAVLYAEYALELSNLDIYFPDRGRGMASLQWREPFLFVAGIVLGLLLAGRIHRWQVRGRMRQMRRTVALLWRKRG